MIFIRLKINTKSQNLNALNALIKKQSELRLRLRYKLLLAKILVNIIIEITKWCIFLWPKLKLN